MNPAARDPTFALEAATEEFRRRHPGEIENRLHRRRRFSLRRPAWTYQPKPIGPRSFFGRRRWLIVWRPCCLALHNQVPKHKRLQRSPGPCILRIGESVSFCLFCPFPWSCTTIACPHNSPHNSPRRGTSVKCLLSARRVRKAAIPHPVRLAFLRYSDAAAIATVGANTE